MECPHYGQYTSQTLPPCICKSYTPGVATFVTCAPVACSFLNVPVNSPDVATWDQMMSDIQEVASSQGSKIPIIYGLDSVHGANYVYGAALFPQSLSVAATFNRSAAYLMAATSAKDTRAAQIPWAFAPILGLMSNPIWPRCYETLGEDPYLASEMATQLICGAQGCPRTLSDPTKVAATAKHFFGYPNPRRYVECAS